MSENVNDIREKIKQRFVKVALDPHAQVRLFTSIGKPLSDSAPVPGPQFRPEESP